MGKEESDTQASKKTMRNQIAKGKNLPGQQVSATELEKLQKTAYAQYPWLSDIKESMLVTDNRKRDCPIVFANDEFEAMSLYPKEEIVGRNCRFLQGKLTNRETVKSIRDAVDSGKELEVEILNYRKDGTPFWNNFLMIPIFKNPKTKKTVTHFIAIQKDITLIKQQDNSNVESWNSTDAAMWLDHVGFGEVSRNFIENNVTGTRLLEITDDDLLQMRVMRTKTRRLILGSIRKLKEAKEEAFKEHEKANAYTSPASKNGLNAAPNTERPSQLALWNRHSSIVMEGPVRVTFKCFFKDEVNCFYMPADCTFRELKDRLSDKYDFKFVVKFEDKQGDIVDVSSNDDMEYLRSQHKGETIPIKIVRKKPTKSTNIAWVQSMADPAVLMDWDGYVLATSPAVETMFGYSGAHLQEAHLRKLLPNYDMGVSSRRVPAEALTKNGEPVNVSVGVSTTPNNTRLALIVAASV